MTFFAALLMLLLQVPQTGNDTTGAISGRVADELGRPIAGVPVVIRQSGYGSDGEKALHYAGRGTTNDRGEYRIFGLKPGTYYALAASAEQTFEEYLRESGTPVAWDEIRGSGYVPTYYPQGTDPASARTLNVGPGSEIRSIDFTLIRLNPVELGCSRIYKFIYIEFSVGDSVVGRCRLIPHWHSRAPRHDD